MVSIKVFFFLNSKRIHKILQSTSTHTFIHTHSSSHTFNNHTTAQKEKHKTIENIYKARLQILFIVSQTNRNRKQKNKTIKNEMKEKEIIEINLKRQSFNKIKPFRKQKQKKISKWEKMLTRFTYIKMANLTF